MKDKSFIESLKVGRSENQILLDNIEAAIESDNFSGSDITLWENQLKTNGLWDQFSYLIAQAEDRLKEIEG